jgi:hypothetical protein
MYAPRIFLASLATVVALAPSVAPVWAEGGGAPRLRRLLSPPGVSMWKRVPSSDRWTAASGTGSGHWDREVTPDHMAMFQLTFLEKQDDAVEIRAMNRILSPNDERASYTGPMVQAASGGGSAEILSLDEGYITAIQICTNTDAQPKIKGARIWGGKIDEEGHVTALSQSPKFERPHCKKWAPKAACGAQKIATAIRAYWYDVYQKGFSGMGLRCSTIAPE